MISLRLQPSAAVSEGKNIKISLCIYWIKPLWTVNYCRLSSLQNLIMQVNFLDSLERGFRLNIRVKVNCKVVLVFN